MKKKTFSIGTFVIILTLLMSLALASCSPPDDGDNYNGYLDVTPQLAESILSKVEFGDKLFYTQNNSEYGYNITGDGFVAYEKRLGENAEETYYGGSGEEFYKVMITLDKREFKRVTKWEALLALEEVKNGATEYLSIMNDNDFYTALEKNKEHGGDFGKLIVSGNVYMEQEGDVIPESGSIVYSLKTVDDIAALAELSFHFSAKRLIEVQIGYSNIEGYVPDNLRNPQRDLISVSFDYDRTLTMPSDKGTDVTAPGDKVTIIRKGSSLPELYNQTKGSKIQLGTPTDDTGTFLGWFYDEMYQFPVEGEYQVGFERNYAEVYAKWQVPAIKTQLNGGAFFAGAESKLSKCIFIKDIMEITPYKKGYEFEGWHKEATFVNEVEYEDYDLITAATTVYAKWAPLVKITLSADISYTLPKLIGAQGNGMGLDYIVPVKRGGVFAGWYKDSGFQTAVTEGNFPTANATYYAKFDKAICIDLNFENATLTPNNVENYVNIPLTASEEYGFQEFFEEITQDYIGGTNGMGESFAGWYKDSALTQPLTRVYPTANMTLYPKITKVYFYIIDDGDGELTMAYFSEGERNINGMKAGLIPVEDILADMAQNLTPPEGKQFEGWYSDAALTTPYQPSDYPTQTTTIYAKYAPIA